MCGRALRVVSAVDAPSDGGFELAGPNVIAGPDTVGWGSAEFVAAEEMGHAAHVEPEPVGAIEIEGGAVAARRPSGEIAKRRFILLGR